MGLGIDMETVVALVFLAFFAFVVWRGGSSNPVGTGQLQKQLNTIGSEVGKIKDSVADCAKVSELEMLRGEMEEMEKRVASSGEVIALGGQILTVNARIGGIEKLAERTDAGVQRLEAFFISKGVGQ